MATTVGALPAPMAAGEAAVERSAESIERTLLDRARRLAEVEETVDNASRLSVLLCRVAGERYAIELRSLEAVRRAGGLVPVPCTPPYVAGVLNVRGEILTVLDLAAALGLGSAASPASPGADAADERHVLLLTAHFGGNGSSNGDGGSGAGAARIGLLVDDVLEVQTVSINDLAPPLSGNEHARGVVNGVTVLDVERLLTGRFEVLEDVT